MTSTIQFRDISAAESSRELRQDYQFTQQSRFRRRRNGLGSMGSSADYHLRVESRWLYGMEYARAMDRDDIITGWMLDLATQCIVGESGFSLNPDTGDAKLDEDLKLRWSEWGNDPDAFDVAGEMTFTDAEVAAWRSHLVDGDTLGLMLGSGQLQLMEAHRCRSPHGKPAGVSLGVKLSGKREHLGYYFTQDEIDPTYAVGASTKFDFIDARDGDGYRQVAHLTNKHRWSLTRGVTVLHRVMDTAGMFEDLNFAKLIQAQVVSAFGVIREKNSNFIGGLKGPLGQETTENRGDGTQRVTAAIEPGMEYESRVGETLKAFSPGVPNAEYFMHAKLLIAMQGLACGLPYVMLMMDASETNFSGYRGAVDTARQKFKMDRTRFTRRWHKPIYEWKVRQWLDADPVLRRIANRTDLSLFRHSWDATGFSYIEPLTDNQADLLQVRNGLTSPRRIQAKRGCEHSTIVRETLEDNSTSIVHAMDKAKEINAKREEGEKVHWRELLFMPTPDGVTLALPSPTQTQPQAGTAGNKKEKASAASE